MVVGHCWWVSICILEPKDMTYRFFFISISAYISYKYFLKELSRAGRTNHSLFQPWPESRRKVSSQMGSHVGLLGATRLRKLLTVFSGHIVSFGCRQNLGICILLKVLKSLFKFSSKFFLWGTLRSLQFSDMHQGHWKWVSFEGLTYSKVTHKYSYLLAVWQKIANRERERNDPCVYKS